MAAVLVSLQKYSAGLWGKVGVVGMAGLLFALGHGLNGFILRLFRHCLLTPPSFPARRARILKI